MPVQPLGKGDPLARHSLAARELKQLLETERAGEPFLAFRDQHGALQLYGIYPDSRPRTLGRRAETDLAIPWDGEVSGIHAELQCLGGEWTVVDDGLSTNGTYVNGRRISGRQRLRDGDRIRIGRTIIAYSAGRSREESRTVSAADKPALQLTDSQRRVLVSLCRPYRDGDSFATPPTNQQIASEVCLSIDAVKMNLRTLFGKFELADLPQNQKRARLAECALQLGVISPRDLD
jgi:hypothetical protein